MSVEIRNISFIKFDYLNSLHWNKRSGYHISIMSKTLMFEFVHIYRESNCIVDKLASKSNVAESKKWWFHASNIN